MDTEKSSAPQEKWRRKRARPSRTEKFVDQWAPAVYVELLQHWAATDDGAMPTREDAERVARERTELLLAGLGEYAEAPPKLLDLNQRSKRPGRRGWRRNARPKEKRDDGDGWYWNDLFGDDC